MDVMTASWYSPCRKLTTCSSSRTTSSSRTATSARSSSVWAESRRSGDQDENRLETAEGCELIEVASEQGRNLRRQVRGQARQSAQRPRERPLQSSVDVLLVPQLLPQLVHLQPGMGKRWVSSAIRQWVQDRAPGRTRGGMLYILLQRNFPISPRVAPVPDALRRRAGGGRLHRHRRRPRDRRPPLLLLHRLEQKTEFESEKE